MKNIKEKFIMNTLLEKATLTTDEAGATMGITSRSIVRRIKRGDFEAYFINGRWQIVAESFYGFLLAYLEEKDGRRN